MPVSVVCKKCGQKLSAKDDLRGKRVKCPRCKGDLTIPEAPEASNTVAAGGLGELLDEVGITASRTGRRCSGCGADLIPEAIICIQCGYNTETGRQLRTRRDIVDRG